MTITNYTDIELACIAAGIKHLAEYYGMSIHAKPPWDPRTSDGVAFRLAVALRMVVTYPFGEDTVRVWYGDESTNTIYEPLGSDPYAATREAIFRAAIEIGKAMK